MCLQRLVVRIAERKGSDTIEAKHRAVIFPLREVREPERIASSEEAWVRRPCSHLRSIGPKNQVCSLSRHEPPNEWRLSCGAKLKYSQTEFYHTVFQEVHRSLWGQAPPASSA